MGESLLERDVVNATVVEVFEDLKGNPRRYFTADSLDFYNKSDSAILRYLTYDGEGLGHREAKERILKFFDENYHKDLMKKCCSKDLAPVYRNASFKGYELEVVRSKKEDYEGALEDLKFVNFYNPFYKTKSVNRWLTFFPKFTSLFGAGIFYMELKKFLSNPSLEFSSLIPVISPTFLIPISELNRRKAKSDALESLKDVNSVIENYEIFRENVEKAQIDIVSPKKAQILGRNVKDFVFPEEFGDINYDSLPDVVGQLNKSLLGFYMDYERSRNAGEKVE